MSRTNRGQAAVDHWGSLALAIFIVGLGLNTAVWIQQNVAGLELVHHTEVVTVADAPFEVLLLAAGMVVVYLVLTWLRARYHGGEPDV